MDLKSNKEGELCVCSLDTNVLLRWLLGDNEKQLEIVNKILENPKLKKIHIADLVIAESVWVMQSVYKMNRNQIVLGVEAVLSHPKFVLNRSLFERLLPLYLQLSSVSFTDLMVTIYADLNKAGPLLTFDKKLSVQVMGVQLAN